MGEILGESSFFFFFTARSLSKMCFKPRAHAAILWLILKWHHWGLASLMIKRASYLFFTNHTENDCFADSTEL